MPRPSLIRPTNLLSPKQNQMVKISQYFAKAEHGMNEILLYGGIFAVAIIGVLVLAIAVKMREVKNAQSWHKTTGRVTHSEVRAQKRRNMDDHEQTRSVPVVKYEYTVNGKRFSGDRISMAEIIPESDIESTLDRYPVGKEVTVYYNPSNPRQAVLERDLPVDFGKGLAAVFAVLGGGAVLILLSIAKVPQLLAPLLPNSENALFVTLSGGLGLFLLLFGFAQERQALAMQTWTPTQGAVIASEVRSYTQWKDGIQHTFYTPGITYRFTVNGREYTSDRYSLGAETGWSTSRFAEKKVKEYPAGSPLTVYYNPKAPAESVLDRRLSGGWMIWILAFGLLALALVSAGVL